MTINNLIWLFVKPSHIILLSAFVGVLLWRRPIGRWMRTFTAVLVVAFGLSPVSALIMRPLETRFEIPTNLDNVAGIIVLAGSEMATLSEEYDQPQLNSMGDRLTTFLLLAERYPLARLVHSGRRDGAPRTLLRGTGIDPQRIVFEDRSSNTCESARNVKAVVQPAPDQRWVLVTSAFHLPRAVVCFRAVDWNVTPYPADYHRGPELFSLGLAGNLADLDLAAHEWIGLLYYRLTGRTSELFPSADTAS